MELEGCCGLEKYFTILKIIAVMHKSSLIDSGSMSRFDLLKMGILNQVEVGPGSGKICYSHIESSAEGICFG